MAETAVDISTCAACNADVRDESLFCYNCGERIRETPQDPVEAVAFEETSQPDPAKSRPPLRSAASLRNRRRAYNRQPVEVSWEPPAGSPIGFVIATVVLTVGALVLLILALYLR